LRLLFFINGIGTRIVFRLGVVDHRCTDEVVLRPTDVVYNGTRRGVPQTIDGSPLDDRNGFHGIPPSPNPVDHHPSSENKTTSRPNKSTAGSAYIVDNNELGRHHNVQNIDTAVSRNTFEMSTKKFTDIESSSSHDAPQGDFPIIKQGSNRSITLINIGEAQQSGPSALDSVDI
jgi:hypothetical protein